MLDEEALFETIDNGDGVEAAGAAAAASITVKRTRATIRDLAEQHHPVHASPFTREQER